MSNDDRDTESSPLRDLGGALGGLARRVRDAVTDLSESISTPEAVREALRACDLRRRAEDFDGAIGALREALIGHPGQENAWSSWALVRAHQQLVEPVEVDEALAAGLAAFEERPAGAHLLAAARALETPAAAKDALRRARRRFDREPDHLLRTFEGLAALIEASAELRAGAGERQRRALEIARARIEHVGGPRLIRRARRQAVDAWLGADRPDRARRWVALDVPNPMAGGVEPEPNQDGRDADAEPSTSTPTPNPLSVDLGLIARVDATAGRAELAWQTILSRPDVRVDDRVRVGLLAGQDVASLAVALDDDHPRLAALARLATSHDGEDLSALAVLEQHAAGAEGSQRRQFVREAAFWALRLGAFDRPALIAFAGEYGAAAPELWAWARRAELETRRTPDPDAWVGHDAPRLRPIADVVAPHGPDEVSVLRDPGLRARTLSAHHRLTTARRLADTGHAVLARAEILEALVDDPALADADAMLTNLALGDGGETLEELLGAATEVLAEVPATIAGVSLEVGPRALRAVVGARERLARPLTIAIMGEFSSGKSTFVNALLGVELAPMGVLPTTNTINVFRRGANARARVHYRDGRVSPIEAAEVRSFLLGLDETESREIRYVEIERGAGSLGDATIVDTPGLNALDPYHERVAREFVDEADAVVWIFSATRGAAASEREVLDELRADGRRVLGILNKADTLDPSESTELVQYLRDNVGDVLVDVLPLSATQALEERAEAGTSPGLEAIERSLEAAFLSRARELKSEVTLRRLMAALDSAIEGLSLAADELDSRVRATGDADPTLGLVHVGDELHARILERADPLSRALLSVGVMDVGRGLVADRLEPQDAEYVDALITDVLVDALREATSAADPELLPVIERTMRPWTRGYLAAWIRRGGAAELTEQAGAAAKDGERALRAAITRELRVVADDWRTRLWATRRDASIAIEEARRTRSARPRAAAIQLRRATIPALRGLRERAGANSESS